MFVGLHMTTMIQIRNVPDALQRRLKARAALAGMSLSDYLLSEIREAAARPTLEELRARLERRSPVTPSIHRLMRSAPSAIGSDRRRCISVAGSSSPHAGSGSGGGAIVH
jgi:plasmid stability protein